MPASDCVPDAVRREPCRVVPRIEKFISKRADKLESEKMVLIESDKPNASDAPRSTSSISLEPFPRMKNYLLHLRRKSQRAR